MSELFVIHSQTSTASLEKGMRYVVVFIPCYFCATRRVSAVEHIHAGIASSIHYPRVTASASDILRDEILLRTLLGTTCSADKFEGGCNALVVPGQ